MHSVASFLMSHHQKHSLSKWDLPGTILTTSVSQGRLQTLSASQCASVDENMRGQDMVEILVLAGGWPFFEDMRVAMNKCAQKHGTNSFTFHIKYKEESYCVQEYLSCKSEDIIFAQIGYSWHYYTVLTQLAYKTYKHHDKQNTYPSPSLSYIKSRHLQKAFFIKVRLRQVVTCFKCKRIYNIFWAKNCLILQYAIFYVFAVL